MQRRLCSSFVYLVQIQVPSPDALSALAAARSKLPLKALPSIELFHNERPSGAALLMSATPRTPDRVVRNTLDPRVAAVLDHLSMQDPAHIPSIDSIASSLNLSASRFRSIFSYHTGTSFSRYIKHLRMRRARIMLQESMLSVKEVRVAVGVLDHSHFARDYKRAFGESPSETRRSCIELKAKVALRRRKSTLATSKRVDSSQHKRLAI